MQKSLKNYYVDLTIGLAFLVCTVSELVFLIPLSWINYSPGTMPVILGLDYLLWDSLHTWSGIALVLGVFLHLVIHLKWIFKMTLRILHK